MHLLFFKKWWRHLLFFKESWTHLLFFKEWWTISSWTVIVSTFFDRWKTTHNSFGARPTKTQQIRTENIDFQVYIQSFRIVIPGISNKIWWHQTYLKEIQELNDFTQLNSLGQFLAMANVYRKWSPTSVISFYYLREKYRRLKSENLQLSQNEIESFKSAKINLLSGVSPLA